jgi:hypothetical protein
LHALRQFEGNAQVWAGCGHWKIVGYADATSTRVYYIYRPGTYYHLDWCLSRNRHQTSVQEQDAGR